MAINRSKPIRFTARGVTDAFDATDKFEGAMQAMSNLIFDPANPELSVSRAGVTEIVNFQTVGLFVNPLFISVHIEIGTRIYGMIATALNAGKDQPFCFDTATSSFVTISGITNANTPTSPATSGPWTPPTMAAIGIYVIVTHPGFDGTGSNFFGVIDLTLPNAPAWSDTNTATSPLTAVPTAVANFFNRAYFAVGNQVQYTDVLDPKTRTLATQALVIGDQQDVNALSGLPVQTTSSGVIGALTVFKRNQCWQVTGDETLANLSLAVIDINTGTNAPRSVVQTPYGIYFSSTGGPFFVDLIGTMRQVTHSLQELEPDLRTPFQNAQVPTRWAAAYTSGVYRVCGQTVIRGQGATNDYWFDEHRRRWNGPHTFVYDCAGALSDANGVNYYVLSSALYPGILIRSDPYQSLNSVFADLSTTYTPYYKTSSFPKLGDQAKKQVAESTIELAAGRDQVAIYTIRAENEIGVELGTAEIGIAPNGAVVWNHFVWNEDAYWSGPLTASTWGGGSLWGTILQGGSGLIWGAGNVSQVPVTVPIPWPFPLVFEKIVLIITMGGEFPEATIGTSYHRYQQTGYQVLGTRVT